MNSFTVKQLRCKLLPALCAAGAMALSGAANAQVDATTTAESDAAAVRTEPTSGAAAHTSRGGANIAGEQEASSDNRAAAAETQSATAGSGVAFTSDDAIATRDDADDAVDTSAADRTIEANRTEAADRTAANTGALYFSEVDNSDDRRLTWDEISTSYEQEVLEADWSRAEFFSQFDSDGNGFLDEDEYSEFISAIGLEQPENRSSFIDID